MQVYVFSQLKDDKGKYSHQSAAVGHVIIRAQSLANAQARFEESAWARYTQKDNGVSYSHNPYIFYTDIQAVIFAVQNSQEPHTFTILKG